MRSHSAKLGRVFEEVRIEHLLLMADILVAKDDVLLRDLGRTMLLNRSDRAGRVFLPEVRRPEGDRHDHDGNERAKAQKNLVSIFSAHESLLPSCCPC